MKENILLLYGPYDEFHVFNRFNVLIPYIRNKYMNYKIIAVIPYTVANIITNADELITISNEELKKTDSNYPDVLDKMGTMERYDCGYDKSNFMKRAYEYVKNKYNDCNIEVLLYSNDIDFSIKSYMPNNCKIYYGAKTLNEIKSPKLLYDWIFKEFEIIKNNIEKGYNIKPFFNDYDKIKNKYESMFNDKTYVFLTRNFKNKQADIYNSGETTKKIIEKLINCGYKIINIGFPNKKYDIINDNYIELDLKELSYSEFLSFCYLSKGLFLNANSGGFSTHVCTTLNLFLLTEEWEKPNFFYNVRKNKNQYYTSEVITENNVIRELQESLKYDFPKETIKEQNLIMLDKINNIPSILNKHLNNRSVIAALGPSLNKYINNLDNYINNDIFISCNLWFRHFTKMPDYWVFANPSLNMDIMISKIMKIKKQIIKSPTIVYADSVDLTDRNLVDKLMNENKLSYISYDQRHFNNNACSNGVYYKNNKKCCDHRIEGRKTIQEELKQFCKVDYMYSAGDTVAVHMIALAILLGCKQIDIIGLDLDYKNGYANFLSNRNDEDLSEDIKQIPPANILHECINKIHEDINIINNSAKNIGVNINIVKG